MDLPVAAFYLLVVAAAAWDLGSNRIPDPLSLGVALLGVASGGSIAGSLACGLAVLAAGLLAASRRWLGAGDAKLIAAVACWTGFDLLLPFLAATSLAGALIALPLAAAGRGAMPFAPAVAIGAGAVLVLSDLGP